MIPKVEFREMTLDENIDVIKWAYYENNDSLNVHEYTLQLFPELADLDSNLGKEEVYKKIEEIVTKHYRLNEENIKREVSRYNLLWKDYNDKYLRTLSSYLNIDWPKEIKVIVANLGIIPVFPRYIDEFSFSIGIDVDDTKLIEVCAHETLHFLWFEKWKTLYPNIPSREYDAPYLPWKYSEMVTDPILNSEPFSKMFEFKEKSYDSFYDLEKDGKSVMEHLRNIYGQDMSIEEKIKMGFDYISQI